MHEISSVLSGGQIAETLEFQLNGEWLQRGMTLSGVMYQNLP